MLIGIMDSAILNYCFRQYCQDRDLEIDDDPDEEPEGCEDHYRINCYVHETPER